MVEDVRQRTRLLLDPRARRRRLGQSVAATDVLPGDPLVAGADGVTMKRPAFFCAFACLVVVIAWTTSAAVQQPPGGRGRGAGRGAPPRTRKAVLAWADTRNGIAQHDSVSHALAVIERLGYESGAYDTYIRTDSNIVARQPLMTTGAPASGGPSLATVDAIFFLGHREVALDAQQK